MMSVELKHHPEEWFFLHNFDIDKVFSTCLLYTSPSPRDTR